MGLLRILSILSALITAYIMVPRDAGDLTAAQLAEGAQGELPIPVGNGAQVIAITADGDVLAFHITGPAGWLRGLTREQVASAMRASLCGTESFRTILASGKALRADVSSDGGPPVAGDVITACPDGSGGGT